MNSQNRSNQNFEFPQFEYGMPIMTSFTIDLLNQNRTTEEFEYSEESKERDLDRLKNPQFQDQLAVMDDSDDSQVDLNCYENIYFGNHHGSDLSDSSNSPPSYSSPDVDNSPLSLSSVSSVSSVDIPSLSLDSINPIRNMERDHAFRNGLEAEGTYLENPRLDLHLDPQNLKVLEPMQITQEISVSRVASINPREGIQQIQKRQIDMKEKKGRNEVVEISGEMYGKGDVDITTDKAIYQVDSRLIPPLLQEKKKITGYRKKDIENFLRLLHLPKYAKLEIKAAETSSLIKIAKEFDCKSVMNYCEDILSARSRDYTTCLLIADKHGLENAVYDICRRMSGQELPPKAYLNKLSKETLISLILNREMRRKNDQNLHEDTDSDEGSREEGKKKRKRK